MSLSDQVVMATRIETLIELLKNLPDYGRVSYVVTAKGDEVKTAFDIVDASVLLVSNTLDGKLIQTIPRNFSRATGPAHPAFFRLTRYPKICGLLSLPIPVYPAMARR